MRTETTSGRVDVIPCRSCGSPVVPMIETAHDLVAYVLLGVLCGTCAEAQERARIISDT